MTAQDISCCGHIGLEYKSLSVVDLLWLAAGHASYLSLTGATIDGCEAHRLGLVSATFADAPQLMSAVDAAAAEMAAKSPVALIGTKRMLLYTRCTCCFNIVRGCHWWQLHACCTHSAGADQCCSSMASTCSQP